MSTKVSGVNLESSTCTTQGSTDNSTNLANTAFVQSVLSAFFASGSGYFKFASGPKVAWGGPQTCDGDTAISFPAGINFTSAPVVVPGTVYPSGNTGYFTIVEGSISTSGFTVHPNNISEGMQLTWIAIGT